LRMEISNLDEQLQLHTTSQDPPCVTEEQESLHYSLIKSSTGVSTLPFWEAKPKESAWRGRFELDAEFSPCLVQSPNP
jgi:hypothetical protein